MIAQPSEADAVFYCKSTGNMQWIHRLFQLKIVNDVSDEGCPSHGTLIYNISI